MNKLIALVLLNVAFQKQPTLVNTKWNSEVTKTCINILTFKKDNKVTEYICELDYTLKGTYKVYKDTVLVTIKDDSHSEDNGKPTFYRSKCVITNNRLIPVENGELVHGKWKYKKVKFDIVNGYIKAKK